MPSRYLRGFNFTNDELRKVRKARRLTQQEFWSAIGITQSGGCRYESGRALPKPMRMLLIIKYGEGVLARNVIKKLRRPSGIASGNKSHFTPTPY